MAWQAVAACLCTWGNTKFTSQHPIGEHVCLCFRCCLASDVATMTMYCRSIPCAFAVHGHCGSANLHGELSMYNPVHNAPCRAAAAAICPTQYFTMIWRALSCCIRRVWLWSPKSKRFSRPSIMTWSWTSPMSPCAKLLPWHAYAWFVCHSQVLTVCKAGSKLPLSNGDLYVLMAAPVAHGSRMRAVTKSAEMAHSF